MNYDIVLISKDSLSGWWKNTILQRSDFAVSAVSDYEAGYQAIAKGPCDLFIAEEWPGNASLPLFVEQVRSTIKASSLMGLVISSSSHPSLQAPPVCACLPLPVSPETFNDAVAKILHLPTRSHRRYLIRMHIQMRGDAKLINTVVSLNINAGGMLVESVKSLPVGKSFFWSISGAKDLEGLVIPGVIFKDTTDRAKTSLHYYVVKFDPSAQQPCQKLGQYLTKNF